MKAGSRFDEAMGHYAEAHARLKGMRELHPFHPPTADDWGQTVGSPEGAALVRQAGDAERKGLAAVERIIHELS